MFPTQTNRPNHGQQGVVPHVGWKLIITILYVITFLYLGLLSIFMILGGFIFVYDLPVISSSDELQRVLFIFAVILSPVPSLFSLILIWKRSLLWSFLGLPGFMVVVYLLVINVAATQILAALHAELSASKVIARYECPDGHAIVVFDQGKDNIGRFHPWLLYDISESTTTLGAVHNGKVMLNDQIPDESKNALATCQYTNGTSIEGGTTFLSDFKNVHYSPSTSFEFSDF